jgi:hypothetical protein
MPMLQSKTKRLSPRLALLGSLAVLGVALVGCQSSSRAAPSSSPPPSPADCDNTVPLNHCGSYMPEYDPDNGS